MKILIISMSFLLGFCSIGIAADGFKEALEMVKSAVVITVSEDSKFIYISRLEEWSKQSTPLKGDKIDIDNMEDKTLELHKEGRDLTKVILVVAKDTEYRYLWKVINLYEKSLHSLEGVDINSIRYIFARPR